MARRADPHGAGRGRSGGLSGALSRHPKTAITGAVVGLTAAGTAIGVAVNRVANRRVRADQLVLQGDLRERLTDAELREVDPLGHDTRRADRAMLVPADDGVLLHVEEIGPMDAPVTVVFVHGYTLSMASWTFQRRSLAEELATANGHRPAARLVFYDQRGHGSSTRGHHERATIEQLAHDLQTVLDVRVPRGPVVLAGHSMGGITIMGLAALRPELFGDRIAAVALISTSSGNLADLTFGLPEVLTRVRAALFPLAAYTMRRRPKLAERTRRIAADLVSTVTRSLSFASTDVDPALSSYVDAMIAGTPVEVIAEFYPALAGMDHTASLEPLRGVPTMVLTGDKDKMIPKEHSDRIVEHMDGAEDLEYLVVADAGHLVLLEKPQEVTDALTRLVRRVVAEQNARRSAS
jgi:pimeloyl-ACP methyl ester carboxylesterase